MSNPFKTPEFKNLFQQWNKILEQDGLKEIENFDLEVPVLKTWHNLKWKNLNSDRLCELKHYYELASELLQTFEFKNKFHKRIWELHCDGLSVRKIARQINRKDFGKTVVHEIIILISQKSGLKSG